MSLLFKILAVTGSASFAGVMLAIGVILGAYWKSLPPAEFLEWFANHSHLVMRAIPLVVVPTLIGLIGTLWWEWNDSVNRLIWLAAFACIAGVLILTAVYFLPTNATFASKSVPVDQVSGKLAFWLGLHNVRIVLALVASGLGVWAVSR